MTQALASGPIALCRTAVVVLAAGSSRRLGTPKQLVRIAGDTLLTRTMKVVTQLGAGHPIVVLGEPDPGIEREVREYGVLTVHNSRAHEGLSTSLRLALQVARELEPNLAAVLFTVCDQPFVHVELLRALLAGLTEQTPIAASAYGRVLGVPAAFAAQTFAELARLQGDEGARSVIRRDLARVCEVSFPEGILDVDRPEDVVRMKDGAGAQLVR